MKQCGSNIYFGAFCRFWECFIFFFQKKNFEKQQFCLLNNNFMLHLSISAGTAGITPATYEVFQEFGVYFGRFVGQFCHGTNVQVDYGRVRNGHRFRGRNRISTLSKFDTSWRVVLCKATYFL
jgi:hypothetical protein